MNKKALIKEIRKHPDGSKMLSLGYSPFFIHKVLVENIVKESPEKTSAERKKSNPPPRSKMEQAADEAWSRGKINPGDCFRSIFFWKSWIEFWFGTA